MCFSFPIEIFTDPEVCMHCRTEEEANTFLAFLDSIGRRWSSGDSYLSESNFCSYGDVCYYFNKGLYGDAQRARKRGRTVLEFSDFLVEDELEKDDTSLNEFFLSFLVNEV